MRGKAEVTGEPGDKSANSVAERSSLTKNIAALSGGQLATLISSAIPIILIPRALGASQMGIYAAAGAVTAILAVVGRFVTSDYMVLEMVLHKDRAARLAGAGFLLRAATAPVFAASILIYVRIADLSNEARLIFYLVTISAVATMLIDSVQACFRFTERMGYMGVSSVLLSVTSDAAIVAIVILGGRAVALSGAVALIAWAALFVNVWWARRLKELSFAVKVKDLSSLAMGGLPYWPQQLAMVVYLYIDIVLLSSMTRPEVVGWYGVASGILGALLFVPTIFCTAWYPRLIAAFGESPEALRAEARPLLGLVPALSIPIAVATAAGADPVIRLVYGSGYSKAVPVMVVLGFCVVPMYTGFCLGAILQAMKRPMALTVILLAGIVLNVCLNIVLIPVFSDRYDNGALGAAVSLLATEVFITAGMIAVIGKLLLDSSCFRRLPALLIASGFMFAVDRVSASLGLGALAVAGIAFIVAAVPLRVVSREESTSLRESFGRYISRRRGRARVAIEPE
jgi:O-antigen/teichoic acid export membrane protein